MAVEDIDIIQPSRTLAEIPIPNTCPTKNPVVIMEKTIIHAPMAAVCPTFISFLKLKSRPKLNNKKTIPNSDQLLMSDVPDISGVNEI